MKRPIFIIVGVIIVFILLLVWLYVLFFNTPQTNPDNLTDLNLTDTTDGSITEFPDNEPVVDVFSYKPLRQLTTKNVVGYQEVTKDASSTPEIYYVEAGTGNIFSININTGEEVRLSKTTIPNSQKAAITPNGQFTLVQSNLGVNSQFFVGEFSSSSDEISLNNLEANIVSFSETADDTFLYAVESNDFVTAKEYYPITGKTKDLFTIPFREVTIDWGETALDAHYVYPKASNELEGYLYQVVKGKIKRLPIDGYGLSATGNNTDIIYSKLINNTYQSNSYSVYSPELPLILPLVILPEKCVFHSVESPTAVCGVNINNDVKNLPDAWYQGILSTVDSLWLVDLTANTATLLVNTFFESGREVDMTDLSIHINNIYFINKNDSTLWLFSNNSETDSN